MLIDSDELKALLNALIEINEISIKNLSSSIGKIYLGDKFENFAFKKCLIKIAELEKKQMKRINEIEEYLGKVKT